MSYLRIPRDPRGSFARTTFALTIALGACGDTPPATSADTSAPMDTSGPPPTDTIETSPPDTSGPACIPACGARICGDDGCGGVCGTCAGETTCDVAGRCVGDRSVGASCMADSECGDGGLCLRDPGFTGGYCTRECGDAGACPPDSTCFDISNTSHSVCFLNCTGDSDCRVDEGYFCDGDNTCYLDSPCYGFCDGRVCGDDGCGGTCGNCGSGTSCSSGGQCIAEVVDPPTSLDCLKLVPLRLFSSEPSAVALLYRIETCTGDTVVLVPEPGQSVSDLYDIREGGQTLSSEAIPSVSVSQGQRVYVSLVLDFSASTSAVVPELIASSRAFARTLVQSAPSVYVGVRIFDGRPAPVDIQRPTRDLAVLLGAIDGLASRVDPNADVGSTNLNGAIVATTSDLQKLQDDVIRLNGLGIVTSAYQVVFTDGRDTSLRVSTETARAAVAEARAATGTDGAVANVQTYAVALSGATDFDAQARTALVTVLGDASRLYEGRLEELEGRFQALAARIAEHAKATHLLQYCSAARSGDRSVTLNVKASVGDARSSILFGFNADRFAPGCVEFIRSGCTGRQCGGFNCGACADETEVCNVGAGLCIQTCLDRNQCSGERLVNPLGHTQTCDQAALGEGISKCGGTCTDTETNRAHCGACGVSCQAYERCGVGDCVCEDGPQALCGGACRDLATDRDHCGRCGNACPLGCRAGACSADPSGHVRVEAGVFTMGSPTTEPSRNAGNEVQRVVTLTRSLWVKETEVTEAEWLAAFAKLPQASTCGPTCPVVGVSWYSAARFLNLRSQREGLQACYNFGAGCNGDAGLGEYLCQSVPTFVGLGCTGYRLPTDAEWEYFARAGTTGMTYSGNFVPTDAAGTEAVLGPIAWYRGNSASKMHAVRAKFPNAWGLYDVLGNAQEWTMDALEVYGATAVTDPLAYYDASAVARGGHVYSLAAQVRAASRVKEARNGRRAETGFRSVRTIPNAP